MTRMIRADANADANAMPLTRLVMTIVLFCSSVAWCVAGRDLFFVHKSFKGACCCTGSGMKE